MAKEESPMAELMRKFEEERERVGEIKTGDELEYPLVLQGLEIRAIRHNNMGLLPGPPIGSMVSIRPVAEEYEEKTFLGVYLGNLPIELIVGLQTKIETLVVGARTNPAIFVPELNKIIYGMESFWGEIKSEKQLRQITNDDIQNIWYVKALQDLLEKQEQTPETEA